MSELRFHEVVIDSADPRTLSEFWAAFSGYEVTHASEQWCTIQAPDHSMKIGFQRVPEEKVGKNRLHLDFSAADEEATARSIEAMGATRRWVSEKPDDPFVVLADPEGNEFCIVRDA